MKRKRARRLPHQRRGKGGERRSSGPPRQLNRTEQIILDYLDDRPGITIRIKDLVQSLAISAKHERRLRKAVDSLVEEGWVQKVKGQKIKRATPQENLAHGRLSLAEGGFGFVRQPGRDDDLFVPPGKLRGAQHGDEVEVMVTGSGRGGKPQARVVRVMERSDVPVIGRFVEVPGRGGLVYPDNPKIPGPIVIAESRRRGAKDQDRVQVEVDPGPRQPHGRIVMVFGPADDPDTRFKALIAEFKFRESFAARALEEAEAQGIEIPEGELAEREDLRDRMIVTIDPESAQDFDDALSLRRLDDNTWELGVHIADVSWYVEEGSALDKEARQRGTSVYTSHGTLPMLPERLSSDLCSLREGEDRRAVSVFMTLGRDAEVRSARLTRSVIRSSKRFTYKQAQDLIIQGRKEYGDELPPLKGSDLGAFIHHLADLARTMRARRFREGGLNLEVPEYEVVIGDENTPVDIRRREVRESNHLVEECMLAANRAVTDLATRDEAGGPRAFVYRVHASPDPEALQELAAMVESLGIEWTLGYDFETLSSKQINDWLERLEDHPLADVVRIHTLRAMAKAEYSTENIGHYGLGFSNYTHFTSPIRRYPDLLVHRILLARVAGVEKYGPHRQEDLERDCELASERERAAQEMERKSLKIRQAEYFANQVGEVFDGTIVRAMPKGAFVEIEDTGAQGFIHEQELPDFYFDRGQQAFVQIDGDAIYGSGTRLKVEVLSADADMGRVELTPA